MAAAVMPSARRARPTSVCATSLAGPGCRTPRPPTTSATKAGLLTAVAVEGFEMLSAALSDAYERTGSFLEVGVAYVRFAADHRGHFEVMFRPELYEAADPAVRGAKRASSRRPVRTRRRRPRRW
jgi:hypothetical protein